MVAPRYAPWQNCPPGLASRSGETPWAVPSISAAKDSICHPGLSPNQLLQVSEMGETV
jgi:hypothetical protein